jgi:hypothetical protein
MAIIHQFKDSRELAEDAGAAWYECPPEMQ